MSLSEEIYDVCGMGNALVDLLFDVTSNELSELGYQPGSMTLVDEAELSTLLERFRDRHPQVAGGGSMANSVMVLTQLGGKGAYIACLGNDVYGEHFIGEFSEAGITLGMARLPGPSGVCLSLIGEDGERTMRTCLGVAGNLASSHIDGRLIGDAKWLFVEGYLLASPHCGQGAIERAVAHAKDKETKVALTASERLVIRGFRKAADSIIEECDLLFANEGEALEISGANSLDGALKTLGARVPHVVVTAGADGAYVINGSEVSHTPAEPVKVRDLTGAGDAFAGAYLLGLCQAKSPKDAARMGCAAAARVITEVGARMGK